MHSQQIIYFSIIFGEFSQSARRVLDLPLRFQTSLIHDCIHLTKVFFSTIFKMFENILTKENSVKYLIL